VEVSTSSGIRVVAISGSLRLGSYTQMALQIALEGAAEAGAQTSLVNLREFDLGFAGMDDAP